LDLDTRSKYLFFLKGYLTFIGLLNISCSDKLDELYPHESAFIKDQVKWQSKLYFPRIETFKQSPIGFGKIVFLGNSITEGGGNWNKRFRTDNIVNRGISGDFTSGVLARLKEITYFQPKALFLLIGINDIFGINDAEISSDYVFKQIIKIITVINTKSPRTKIYIQTLLPVDEKKYLKVKGFYPDHNEPLPERIVEINKKLLNSSQKNYSVINLHKHFIDESNDVKGFLFKDGVHLNEEGYELWTKILEKYIYQFEKKATE